MNAFNLKLISSVFVAASAWLMLPALPVQAAGGTAAMVSGHSADHTADRARYESDLALCNSGRSSEDRATCVREAKAAYAQARKGTLRIAGASYEQNAIKRCEPLSGSDHRACIARMQGKGTISGSVAEGGIYRELRTVVPAKQSMT